MEHLFVLKTLSRTQWATKVEIFVGFSLELLHCRDPAYVQSAIFPAESMHVQFAHSFSAS